MSQGKRVKVSIPPNTLFFLRKKASVYGTNITAYIRLLVIQDVQKELPPAVRKQVRRRSLDDHSAAQMEGKTTSGSLENERPFSPGGRTMSQSEFFSSLQAIREGRF